MCEGVPGAVTAEEIVVQVLSLLVVVVLEVTGAGTPVAAAEVTQAVCLVVVTSGEVTADGAALSGVADVVSKVVLAAGVGSGAVPPGAGALVLTAVAAARISLLEASACSSHQSASMRRSASLIPSDSALMWVTLAAERVVSG